MDHNNEFVSVIIPTHNRSDCVLRAIQSVLAQTHKNLECIVVSDGSVDNTDDVVNKIAAKDERVKYISYAPAKGGNHARNIGIKNAKHDYIAFLDDDDLWYPDKLTKQLSVFASNPEIGLVCTGLRKIYVDENTTSLHRFNIPDPDMSKLILISNYIGTTTTVMTKAKIIEKAGGFDENLSAQQDYDLWIRICQITKVSAVNDICVDYYIFENNNQISKNLNKVVESSKKINKKYEHLIDKLSSKEKKLRGYTQSINIAIRGLRNADPKHTRKYAAKAFKKMKKINAVKIYLISFFPYKIIFYIKNKLFKKK